MNLYPHQKDMIDKVREQMRVGINRMILVSPTGSGKTVMGAFMMRGIHDAGQKWWFVVHRKELIDQTSRTLKHWGVPHGFIAAGMTQTSDPIQVCSIDTIRARLGTLDAPDGIIIDEAHRSAAASYTKMLDAWPKAGVIGLTGTPTRLDGKPLGALYQAMVVGPTTRELMDMGMLAKYRLFAPPGTQDFSGVKITRAGEFDRKELAAAMNGTTIYGNAIKEYRKHCDGRQAAVFCVDIKHAEATAARFNAAGVPAACIHGKLAGAVRAAMVDGFRSGHIRVLTSVGILVEGFDLAGIGAIIMLRPTASLVMYLQMIGRGLRPDDGRKAVILDPVGNSQRHGYPDDDREWSLDGRKKGQGKAAAEEKASTYCPVHFAACRRPDMPCGELMADGSVCGWLPPVQERKIEEVAGDLEEVDIQAQRRQKRAEEGAARTLEDLIALGKARGYKQGWAMHRWAARHSKQQRVT